MTEIDYPKRRLHLETVAAGEGWPQNTMPDSDGLGPTEIPAEPERYLAIMGNDAGRWYLGGWREVMAAIEEDVLYGYDVQRAVDLDTGEDAPFEVRVNAERPGQTHLDHLRAMHRFLFPERYGLDKYGFPCEEGYVHEWDSGTIEDVAAMIERALVDDGSTEILTTARERYRAELRREVQA